MAEELDLTPDERVALEAVTALEAEGETASIEAVASRAGLDAGTAETVLSRLAVDRDLVREIAIEQHADTTGVGRAYVTKVQPSPR